MKEYIKETAQSFFIVVTLINLALMILGRAFPPTQQMGYEAFGYPVLYGLCSMIPTLIMYFPKELSVRGLLVRKFIQMLLIAALLVLLIFGPGGIRAENIKLIIAVSVSVIVIYVLEEILSWLINTRSAEQLTEKLHRYQELRQ